MSDLMNQKTVDTSHLTPIEIALGIDENGMTTARRLYEFLELNTANYSHWCKRNIIENEFAEEGIDYWRVVFEDETPTGGKIQREDFKLTAHFSKKLSVKGNGEKAEQAREYFTRLEERVKDAAVDRSKLDPRTQLMLQLAESISRQELEQKRQAAELEEIREKSQRAIERVESIREVVALDTTSWREDTRNLINKIALEWGGGMAFQQIRAESYELLEKRMGVSLKTRLTNKRRRMADEGICKSRRDSLTYVDVISEDKKLIEGYVAIVKEMAVKYGVA